MGIIEIIIIIVVLSIIFGILSFLAELVGGWLNLIIIGGVLAVAYYSFSWKGVAIAIGIYIVYRLLRILSYNFKETVKEHDARKRETAVIQQETRKMNLMHDNDNALLKELNKNCLWLGYMTADAWKNKLPNFVNRAYTTDFYSITQNFAHQIEQQYILQNDDWFEPYKLHILKHDGGVSVTKLLHEVNCPQLKMTHCTPDGDLINTYLVRGCKSVSQDVPALFRLQPSVNGMNESVFAPTKYLKKLYSAEMISASEPNAVEHDISDL